MIKPSSSFASLYSTETQCIAERRHMELCAALALIPAILSTIVAGSVVATTVVLACIVCGVRVETQRRRLTEAAATSHGLQSGA